MSNKYLIVIAGPTASGKTNIAIQLAQYFNTEIVSSDSRQCFKEIPIGTAQPTVEEMNGIVHHFIASHSIHDEMNVGIYEKYALQCLENIFINKNVAILCGGTGLYIDAVCKGIDDMPDTDISIKDEIEKNYSESGIEWLQKAVQNEDPEFWKIAEQQNPARLIRALAFFRSNKISIAQFRNKTPKVRPFQVIKIAIDADREILYDRINNRVDEMMKKGLLNEVAKNFPNRFLKNLSTVGYSEFYNFNYWPLNDNDLYFAIDKVKQHSRNYAKRQITWFKKDNDYKWINAENINEMLAFINSKINS
jgi:tRNA dimethylallyltransferase